jgi:hypothetical protein
MRGWFAVNGLLLILLVDGCSPSSPTDAELNDLSLVADTVTNVPIAPTPTYVVVQNNIRMQDYFAFIDSLSGARLDSIDAFREYVLVNANPWIIDSLRVLDYYHQKARGLIVYDQSQQIILHPGDSLLIPDQPTIAAITEKLKTSRIEVNIPEFKLWVIQSLDTILTCKVRVGQNKNKYLDFYQREVDLRTPTGEGVIVEVRKNPKYFDPQTGEEYLETKRDDGRRTKMPIIPSLTPTINGQVTGTLIHATTNPKSLGKAYSNGCIGTSEPDIWSIFYLAPVGTKVTFRYDLEIIDERGQPKKLRDIYYRSDE